MTLTRRVFIIFTTALFVGGFLYALIIHFRPLQGVSLFLTKNPDAISMGNRYHIAASTQSKKPQIVVFSFDGSRSLPFWDDTFAFQDEMERLGERIRFTYFISGVYFLAPEYKDHYHGPGRAKGISAVDFAESVGDVNLRVRRVNEAYLRGNEIGSHINGHFDGSRWTEAEWQQEFGSFKDLIFNVQKNNHELFGEKPIFRESDIIGFRAPLLAHNDVMYSALKLAGYQYDASLVANGNILPKTPHNELVEFPLQMVRLHDPEEMSISMDYNFFQMQTRAKDILKKSSPEWISKRDQVESTYLSYFQDHYSGNRTPIYVANHFTLWNDGLYFEATKDVARRICGKPEVYCVTYREMLEYLNQKQASTTTK